ncbi:hypothetical protein BGX34_008837 [Mortierella sp. NVP85]|nr:hypothetical protein BGX34_008837 [Mortierella sp. NVP85]
MGLFAKPLLPARYENEDVQVNPALFPNITILVVGLAKGEITVLSGKDDMIHIRTSVQAKESIIRNAAELEPTEDGTHYTYTIHTPMEFKLEKAVTFQVFITIPKTLESLDSLTIQGENLELSIGNIGHTLIKNFSVSSHQGDTTIENLYAESAIIKSVVAGSIFGKYSVARLYARAKCGKIKSDVHLLHTDESQPAPKVICSTVNYPIDIAVDGRDLSGPFTVEAKTQCQPLDVKIMLASEEQNLRGNFINFGGPTRVKLSRNYQGRIESRTHYGQIFIEEPEFKRIEGAVLSLPSASDRKTFSSAPNSYLSSNSSPSTSPSPSVTSSVYSEPQSVVTSPILFSQESPSWSREDPYAHHQPYYGQHSRRGSHGMTVHSSPASAMVSEASSCANSIYESLAETRSIRTIKSVKGRLKKKKRDAEKESNTKEVIGTIGDGGGLVMVKNSSGDIAISLM